MATLLSVVMLSHSVAGGMGCGWSNIHAAISHLVLDVQNEAINTFLIPLIDFSMVCTLRFKYSQVRTICHPEFRTTEGYGVYTMSLLQPLLLTLLLARRELVASLFFCKEMVSCIYNLPIYVQKHRMICYW
jgi:hypothetical protein